VSASRLDRIVHAHGGTTEIYYDAAGRRSSTLEHDGTLTTYRWNHLDRLIEIVRSTADGRSWRLRIDHDAFGMLRRVHADQHDVVALLGDAALAAVPVAVASIAGVEGARRARIRCRAPRPAGAGRPELP